MGFQQVRVIIIPVKLELLHLSNVIHDSKLLRQICFHPLLNHVAASHVLSHTPLKNFRVTENHYVNLTEPVHPKM